MTDETNNSMGSLKIDPVDIHKADESYIVPKADQPRGFGAFIHGHSGSYNKQYYTKAQSSEAAMTTWAKFISVGLGTFSLMKISDQIFNQLPEVQPFLETPYLSLNAVDTAYVLTAAGFAWGISKIDSSLLFNDRNYKTALEAKELYGLPESDDTRKPTFSAKLPRYIFIGCSVVTTASIIYAEAQKSDIEAYVRDKYNVFNEQLVDKYRQEAADFNAANNLANLIQTETDLRAELVSLQQGNAPPNASEQSRLQEITEEISQLRDSRAEPLRRFGEARSRRDAAQTELEAELRGARGATAGDGPLAAAARFERDTAQREMDTEQGILDGIDGQIETLNAERAEINRIAQERAENDKTRIEEQKVTLEGQINDVVAQIALIAQQREELGLNDPRALAEADPTFRKPTGSVVGELVPNAYEYLWNKGGVTEWMLAVIIPALLAFFELSPFLSANRRRTNGGDLNAYMAEYTRKNAIGEARSNDSIAAELRKAAADIRVETIKEQLALLSDADKDLFMRIAAEQLANPQYSSEMKKEVLDFLETLEVGRSEALEELRTLIDEEREKAGDMTLSEATMEQLLKPDPPSVTVTVSHKLDDEGIQIPDEALEDLNAYMAVIDEIERKRWDNLPKSDARFG